MPDKIALRYIGFHTPVGWLLLAESDDGIALVDFLGQDRPSKDAEVSAAIREYPGSSALPGTDSGLLGQTKAHILAYFMERAPIPRLPLDLGKGTGFDRSVWKEIAAIPFAESLTYGQIAARISAPGAFRAVGRACGRNPVPILIACHRVLGSGGKLGGYSGGLHIKRALLELETSD